MTEPTSDTANLCALCGMGRSVGVVCRRHYHHLDDALTQIEELYALIGDLEIPGPTGDGRAPTRTGSPAPGSTYLMSLTDKRAVHVPHLEELGEEFIPDVPGTLASWATLVAGKRDRQPDGYDPTVTEAVRMLLRHRNWIVQQADWITDLYEDIDIVHRHLASATRGGLWNKPVAECPNDGRRLFNTIGADAITCTYCGKTWTGIALARLRLVYGNQEAS